MGEVITQNRASGVGAIYILFTISGAAAILYQLIWQRVLFSIYGVSVEAVSAIVTAFLLGLGFGSLLGGRIAKNPRRSLLELFALFEIGIGIFGIFSLKLFYWVASLSLHLSILETGVVTLLMIILPTMLMGATLPMLVSHYVSYSGNVGRTVGAFYFFNTLGSGLICIFAGYLLFKHLGEHSATLVAGSLNILVATGVYLILGRAKRK